MVFGKHINRLYLRYAPALLLGLLTLVVVDILQLRIPNLYQLVINGINDGYVLLDGVQTPFTLELLLDRICMPMVGIIVCMVAGRFLWRVCNCQKATALAAATFKESTPCDIGILTV